MLNYQNYYFVKVLLFCCLKYFTNDNRHYLYQDNVMFSILLYYLQVSIKLKNSKITFEKYNDFLYKSENEKYFKKNEKYKEKVKETVISLKENVDNKKFEEALNKFLK